MTLDGQIYFVKLTKVPLGSAGVPFSVQIFILFISFFNSLILYSVLLNAELRLE